MSNQNNAPDDNVSDISSDRCWSCCHSDSELDMSVFDFEWDEVQDFDGNYIISGTSTCPAEIYTPGILIDEETSTYGTKIRYFENPDGTETRIYVSVHDYNHRNKPVRSDNFHVIKTTYDPNKPVENPSPIFKIISNQGNMDSLLTANKFLQQRIQQVIGAKINL